MPPEGVLLSVSSEMDSGELEAELSELLLASELEDDSASEELVSVEDVSALLSERLELVSLSGVMLEPDSAKAAMGKLPATRRTASKVTNTFFSCLVIVKSFLAFVLFV